MSKFTLHQWNNHCIAQAKESMQIAGMTVHKGHVNASQMCKVKDKKLQDYLQLETTKIFVETLAAQVKISTTELIVTIKARSAGSNRGTWIHPEIALHLAEWLDLEYWAWATLAEAVISMPLPLMLPRTYFDAITALATLESDLEKTSDILVATKDCLKDCLLEKQELLEAQQPMRDHYNRAMNSEWNFRIGDVAKILGYDDLGRNKLLLFLRHMRVLTLNNLPYQKYIDAGYFNYCVLPCPNEKGRTQFFVTQKGIGFINRLLRENYYPRCFEDWDYFQSYLEDDLDAA